MNSFKKALLFGFLIWLFAFAVSFIIWPLHENNRAFFESIMPVAVVLATVFFAILYFKKVDAVYVSEGIAIGLIWLCLNLIIDLLMFSWGPMKMPLSEYMMDIGFTYLMIPVITYGFGRLLEARAK